MRALSASLRFALGALVFGGCGGLDSSDKRACVTSDDCVGGRVCFELRCLSADEVPDGAVGDGGLDHDAGADDDAAAPMPVGLDCGTVDRDEDGLPDCYELSIGTSPVDADTDGDGLSDYREVVDLAFDAERNNYLFNPRIADVPELAIVMVDRPVLYFEGTQITSSEEERSQASLTRVVTAQTDRNSTVVEQNHEVDVDVTVSKLRGPSGSASYGFSHNTTKEHTVTWSREQTQENRASYRRLDSESNALTGARLVARVEVRNAGNLAFSLSNLSIAADYADVNNRAIFQPLGNLTLDGDDPLAVDLGPGESTQSPLLFSLDLSLGQVQAILERSTSIAVRPASWRLTDESDRAFAFDQTAIAAKDIAIIIDYGPRLHAQSEAFRRRAFFVSASADFERKSVSARVALQDIVQLSVVTGTNPWDADGDGDAETVTEHGIVDINGAAIDPTINGYWLLRLESNDGNRTEVTILDMRTESYDLDSIELRGSDVLHLVYVEDADRDGLAAREEALYGTSDHDVDSDADGIDDYTEATVGWTVNVVGEAPRTVYPHPALADADGDGWNDHEEREHGTDPYSADTDGDGDIDSEDFDPLDAEASIRQGLVAEWRFDRDTDDVPCGISCDTCSQMCISDDYGLCPTRTCDYADTSGGDQHLFQLTHTAGRARDRFDVADRALEMGSNINPDPRFVVLPPLPIRDHFSLAVWVKHCTQCSSTDVYFAIGAPSWHLFFGEDYNSESLAFIPDINGSELRSEQEWERQDGQWHLYVGSYACDAGEATMRIFRDGEEVATAVDTPSGGCLFTSDPVLRLQGTEVLLDDLRVYDRALDAGDAAVLYRQGGFGQ